MIPLRATGAEKQDFVYELPNGDFILVFGPGQVSMRGRGGYWQRGQPVKPRDSDGRADRPRRGLRPGGRDEIGTADARRWFGDTSPARLVRAERNRTRAKGSTMSRNHPAAAFALLVLALGARAADPGADFAEKAAKEKGAVKTASGLVYRSLKDGTGEQPTVTSTVKVNYRGTLVDGTVFDASDRHGGPISFPLNGVIRCWTEGVAKMKVGGKAQLVCPPQIAYGARGAPPEVPPNATLVFEVELLGVQK